MNVLVSNVCSKICVPLIFVKGTIEMRTIRLFAHKELRLTLGHSYSVSLRCLSAKYGNFDNSERDYSRFSASRIMSGSVKFNINNYDIIGFDLDNTLLRYNLPNTILLEYENLAKFMVEKKNYSKDLLQPIDNDYDFLQRGLFLDAERGNILRLLKGGYIEKASHGTKFLSDSEINEIYKGRQWDIAQTFVDDPLVTWNGPLSQRIRALLDYFDIPVSLIFARAVDSIDANSEIPPEEYNIWPDILSGLIDAYTREHYSLGKSDYFEALKKDIGKYVLKTNPKVINWLKELKSTKATFLLTGSYIDYADLIATEAFGSNWRDLFDVVICFGRKPGFFFNRQPFMEIKDFTEMNAVDDRNIELNKVYSQGNWLALRNLLSKKHNVKRPKSLYIGDNLVQDVFTPAKHADCEAVAVVEEMLAENPQICNQNSYEWDYLLKSNCWGSFFGSSANPTFWNDVIQKRSRLCIPKVDVIAENPINYTYDCFEKDNLNGFYPKYPL